MVYRQGIASTDAHKVDERAIPPAGRIGETEDLIGSVFVENGKVSSLLHPVNNHVLADGIQGQSLPLPVVPTRS